MVCHRCRHSYWSTIAEVVDEHLELNVSPAGAALGFSGSQVAALVGKRPCLVTADTRHLRMLLGRRCNEPGWS